MLCEGFLGRGGGEIDPGLVKVTTNRRGGYELDFSRDGIVGVLPKAGQLRNKLFLLPHQGVDSTLCIQYGDAHKSMWLCGSVFFFGSCFLGGAAGWNELR